MSTFRLYDFNEYNKVMDEPSDDERDEEYTDKKEFIVQMFGVNSEGKTCSIIVENYEPFFYAKVPRSWTNTQVNQFKRYIKNKLGKFYKDSLTLCKLEKHKKLYGFDAGAMHNFVLLKFKNIQAFNKAKNLWYTMGPNGKRLCKYHNYNSKNHNEYGIEVELKKDDKHFVQLYESNIPPLLRLIIFL